MIEKENNKIYIFFTDKDELNSNEFDKNEFKQSVKDSQITWMLDWACTSNSPYKDDVVAGLKPFFLPVMPINSN